MVLIFKAWILRYIIIQKEKFSPEFYLSRGNGSMGPIGGKNPPVEYWPPGGGYCCPWGWWTCPCATLKYKVTIIPIKHIVKFDFT